MIRDENLVEYLPNWLLHENVLYSIHVQLDNVSTLGEFIEV